jgi:hypothetical protein
MIHQMFQIDYISYFLYYNMKYSFFGCLLLLLNVKAYGSCFHDRHPRPHSHHSHHHHHSCNHPYLESSESHFHDEPSVPIESDVDVKFTSQTIEPTITGYRKRLSNSKAFSFEIPNDMTVSVLFVSTTENFHPQYAISVKEEGKYSPIKDEDREAVFNFDLKKGTHVVEIGYGINVSAKPFKNIKTGNFVLRISNNMKSLPYQMADENIKVMAFGFTGTIPFIDGATLQLYNKKGKKAISQGHMNYKITPYFNSSKSSITFYYNYTRNKTTSLDKKRTARVIVKCNKHANKDKVNKGKGILKYVYNVESEKICDFINEIK